MTTPGQPESPPPSSGEAANAAGTVQHGRCHDCGYSLVGLSMAGSCPECGTAYNTDTARRLQPWPSAFMVCLRLGWPIAGMLIAGVFLTMPAAAVVGFVLMWAMIVAVAANSYFQVRSMLRRSLPNAVRTKGPVAILRAIGTAICVIILLAFVGAPLALGVGCLVLLAGEI